MKNALAKVSKASVDYSRGMPSAHCAICRHFLAPHGCEIVAGLIDPQYWCKRFARGR